MARLPIATATPTTTVAISQEPQIVSDTPAPGLFAVSTSSRAPFANGEVKSNIANSSDLSNSGAALISGSTSIPSPTPTDAPLARVIESEARDKIIIYIIIGVVASLIGLALLYIVHRKFKKVRTRRMRTTSRLRYRNLTFPSKEAIGSPTATPASIHSLCDMQATGAAESGVRSIEDAADAEEGELTPTPGNVLGHADWPREAVTPAPLVEAQMLSHHSRVNSAPTSSRGSAQERGTPLTLLDRADSRRHTEGDLPDLPTSARTTMTLTWTEVHSVSTLPSYRSFNGAISQYQATDPLGPTPPHSLTTRPSCSLGSVPSYHSQTLDALFDRSN